MEPTKDRVLYHTLELGVEISSPRAGISELVAVFTSMLRILRLFMNVGLSPSQS